LMDGGGSKVLAASPNGTDEMLMFCSNAPMTIFNEGSCKLSFDENACSPYGLDKGWNRPVYTTTNSFLPAVSATLVCGSRGEVTPDPNLDDFFELENRYLDSHFDEKSQRSTVWMNIALNNEDQLRQRVAWALSQIFVVSPNSQSGGKLPENYLHFYDIFVHNALGSYRDVIREVAFHPRMGEMLTYVGSKHTAYGWHWRGDLQFPDENFARELFQLFTTGLVKLNMDGTPVLDRYGNHIKTFDSKDIVSFGRAWTGEFKKSYFCFACLVLPCAHLLSFNTPLSRLLVRPTPREQRGRRPVRGEHT
jgi:hypothetical protein